MRVFKYTIILILSIFFSYVIFNYFYHDLNKDIKKIDFNKAKKLMIVAHPDDETLWGGSHLISDDYLVVCITCGPNRKRAREIKSALKISNDQYLALWYPDKTLGTPDSWSDIEKSIYNDLEKIIKMKKWKTIVTHNPDGEYGHLHHIKTNKIVTEIYNNLDLKNNLYFFGKYYTKNKLKETDNIIPSINRKNLNKKITMLKKYKSQNCVREKFDHMYEYENWTKYVKLEEKNDNEK